MIRIGRLRVLPFLDLKVPVERHARAGRNQPAQNDVLLQAAQVIHASFQRCFGEHPGRLLEGGGGDEGLAGEGGLGDAQQLRFAGGGGAIFLEGGLVDLLEAMLVHLLVDDEGGVAHFGDLHPAHHLADDGLDVLVVDGHALGPVDFLDFVEQEGLEGLVALDFQDVVGGHGTFGELFTGADLVAVLNLDVLAARDEVFLVVARLVLDDDLLVATHPVAVFHGAGHFADDGGILGLAAFEQFGDPGQAAGDVGGLGLLAGGLGQHVAGFDGLGVFHFDVGAGGDGCSLSSVGSMTRLRNRPVI